MKAALATLFITISSIATSLAGPSAVFDQALQAFNGGDPAEAIRLWSLYLEDPDLTTDERVLGLQNRAGAHYMAQQPENAVADFSEALKFRSKPGLYSGRGAAYANAGRIDEAIRDYSIAIQLNPHFAIAFYNRGNLHMGNGDLKAAINDYSRALEINDQFEPAHLRLGKCMEHSGQFSKARQHYDKAIELEGSAIAYLHRGNLLKTTGQLQEAIEDYTRVIDDRPEWGFRSRGYVHLALEQYEEAIDDLTRALEFGEPNAAFLADRARAYTVIGMDQEALDDLNTAVELGPDHRMFRSRGFLHLRLHKFKEAAADLRQYLSAQEEDAYARLFLYLATAREGNPDSEVLVQRGEADWTNALMQLFIGKITPTQCLEAVSAPTTTEESGRLCEAYYYIGQVHMIHGDHELARSAFEDCVDTNQTRYLEFIGARSELEFLSSSTNNS